MKSLNLSNDPINAPTETEWTTLENCPLNPGYLF